MILLHQQLVQHREHTLFFLQQGGGTPFASPVPTVKISSNNLLFSRKNNWIDFNCGELVDDSTLEELSQKLYDYVLRVASGEKVKAEEAGFHDMAIFKQGVTL